MTKIILFVAFVLLAILFILRAITSKKKLFYTFSILSVLIGLLVMFVPWSLFDNEEVTTPRIENRHPDMPSPSEPKPASPVNKDHDVPTTPINGEDPTEPNDRGKETIPNESENAQDDPKENVPPKSEKPSTPTMPKQEKINVPADRTVDYKVIIGDTLWSIATRSGVTVAEIKLWNHLSSDTIYVGQTLQLYGKNVKPVPTPPPDNAKPVYPNSTLISHGNLSKKQIALTFDAGSDAVGIRILDVLEKYDVNATFFLTGKWVEMFPTYAKRIVASGHDIGNHSYSHPDAVTTESNTFKQDIIKAEQAIIHVTGKSPRPYFRFPYGSYNSNSLKTVGEVGYSHSIHWSLDTIDWQQPETSVIVNRILQNASNGDIILMHIGGKNTPEAVDQVIPKLNEKGFQLVTLSEMFK
ncbi:polysaccharide deacetylase family protein [Bacillus sp. B15-48]|uniref:polysaccharide deacetylase family protein n=1 Tax=Bacillus sp. B15-48 TaxID=1548601 RepID=UPI00193FE76A|nr:polysaccharide deacetylase family protein [Bacillus sp. B15-48]